jgi:hypothetical protein
MPSRGAALAAVAAVAVATAGGCGMDDRPLPAACVSGAAKLRQALAAAPAQVRLGDGTSLSTCVERARSDGDIQTLGFELTRTADDLAASMRSSDASALALGYLVGAVRRGASTTNGIHEELVRRVEQATGLGGAPPARRAAFERGRAAGERSG